MGACDTTTGLCALPPLLPAAETGTRLEILYVTDPLCSGCWALEPAWRRLLHHHGDALDVRHVYGGLLPGWNGFEDRAAGIRVPADVAPHWRQVARHTGQTIDDSVWLVDPPGSSYPASEAAHVARLLDPVLEAAFLRRVREAVFLQARNIARRDVLIACAAAAGLDAEAFTILLDAGAGRHGFAADLAESRRLGVHGFPTLVVDGRPRGIEPLMTVLGPVEPPSPEEALRAYERGTLAEFSALLELDPTRTADALVAAGADRADGQWVSRSRISSQSSA